MTRLFGYHALWSLYYAVIGVYVIGDDMIHPDHVIISSLVDISFWMVVLGALIWREVSVYRRKRVGFAQQKRGLSSRIRMVIAFSQVFVVGLLLVLSLLQQDWFATGVWFFEVLLTVVALDMLSNDNRLGE